MYRPRGAAPAAIVPFHKREFLKAALESLQLWEEDQQRYGIGFVALSFHNGYWLVLVSQDLIEAALPF